MYKNPVKITVIKMLSWDDVYGEKPADVGDGVTPYCQRFQVGQEFIADKPEGPDGFCAWAWNDIRPAVLVLSLGGDFPWMKAPGVQYTCCTDGARPVFFKLERLSGC